MRGAQTGTTETIFSDSELLTLSTIDYIGYANDQQRQNEGTNGQNPSTNTYGDRGTDNMNGAQPQLGVGADPYGRAQGPGGK